MSGAQGAAEARMGYYSAAMSTANKRIFVALAATGAVLILAVGVVLTMRAGKAESWNLATEGFLAIATPCCARTSLWDALDTITPDDQRARPASAAEAAHWLNDWPYRSREDHEGSQETPLHVSLQNAEVRCVGPPTGGKISQQDGDEVTVEAIRYRRECVYAKWKIWAAETADERLNERHTVWADDDGFFHGRVDYWQPE